MSQRDLIHNWITELILATVTSASVQKSSAVRCTGNDGISINFHFGATLDLTSTYKVQESDTTTDGDFTDAAAGDIVVDDSSSVPALGALAVSTTVRVGYVGKKKYCRGVFTPGGSSIVTITASKGYPAFGPYPNGVVNQA
jgi:hypothetical protein